MRTVEGAIAALAAFTACYHLSVLLIGRWWGPPGQVVPRRQPSPLPVRLTAGCYLVALVCIASAAWADAILQRTTWVTNVLIGAAPLIIILEALAEGLLAKRRSTREATPSV